MKKTDGDELTVGTALLDGTNVLTQAGVENAHYDAAELLIFATSLTRTDFFREPERTLSDRERLIFEKAVSLRRRRRPLAYIVGERWFYGRSFKINRAVLIPRPETELLIGFALHLACDRDAPLAVADIGTGSGCIAVTIALELPNAQVAAVDLSHQALLLARKNVARHGVKDRVTLYEGDLLQPIAAQKFDIVVSNPPYIAEWEMPALMPEVKDYEPALALWQGAGEDGTELHRRLLDEARSVLSKGGLLAMEVGFGQAASVSLYAEQCGYKPVYSRRDLSGIERVVAAQWMG